MIFLLAVEGETREIFEDMNVAGKVIFYLLSFAATAIFIRGCWQRIAKYRQGRSVPRLRREPVPEEADPKADEPDLTEPTGQRWAAAGAIASNSTVAKRDIGAGVAHFFIFWGFITLFIGTVILTIDEDVVRLGTNAFGEERSFFKGVFYMATPLCSTPWVRLHSSV